MTVYDLEFQANQRGEILLSQHQLASFLKYAMYKCGEKRREGMGQDGAVLWVVNDVLETINEKLKDF